MTHTVQGSDRGVDEIFEALADRRRRQVVRALDRSDGGIALSDLSQQLAALVDSTDDSRQSDDEAATPGGVRTSLRQVHLPLLSEANVAERRSDDVVRPGAAFDAAIAILEAGPESAETTGTTARNG